jgi:lipopolysaccharide export system protein LptA
VISLLLAAALAAPGALPAQVVQGQPVPAAAAHPQPPGPPGLRSDKPVRMDAEEVRFSWKNRQFTVVGKPLVTLFHDDATLTCRKLTGENDLAGQLKVATCTGDVKLVRGPRTVTCERAVYDKVAARVVCNGSPVLRDAGGTEASGTSLTWDLAADEVRLEGAAQVTVPGGQLDLEPSAGGPGAARPKIQQPPGGRP